MGKIKVGIVGASGLVGGELLKHLLSHPQAEIIYPASDHAQNKNIADCHPFLKGRLNQVFKPFNSLEMQNQCDVVFVAKGHADAFPVIADLWNGRLKIIDLSADFRLDNQSIYEKTYETTHRCFHLSEHSAYGIPELNRTAIKTASLIANPGCYPTSVLIPLLPLIRSDVVDSAVSIIIHSFSGVSGAGATPKPGKNLFLDNFQNVIPYATDKHRHAAEIAQELDKASSRSYKFIFSPNIIPVANGILSIISFQTARPLSQDALMNIFHNIYKNEPFVRIFSDSLPELKNSTGTNFCDIGAYVNSRQNSCIIYSCIDNMCKGAATQAIQNMNILFEQPETAGLL